MTKKTSILDLGNPADATAWENGCKSLGVTTANQTKRSFPEMAQLETFFATKPHWIYFSGHFGGSKLYNHASYQGDSARGLDIVFNDDSVEIERGEGSKRVLQKQGTAFQLNTNCEVTVWGACSVCGMDTTIRTLWNLFGEHLILGFSGISGSAMTEAMLGGGFIKGDKHFFSRLMDKDLSQENVRNAWMETAKYGYGGGGNQHKFKAIDPDGQMWELKGGQIEKGRKISK